MLTTAATRPGRRSAARRLARALVAAGHVASVQQAFDRWLATGRPAFVPRTGPSPAAVVSTRFTRPAAWRRSRILA